MSKKDDYVASMESQIKKWDVAVDELNTKGQKYSAEARSEYEKQMKAMRANRDLAYAKLQELRAANEAAWQNMQSGMESAWNSMKTALDKASSQYK